jgi:PAS domain-containing protein
MGQSHTLTPLTPADLGIGRLFSEIRDAVVVGDATTGRIALWNPAAERLFGYTADEAIGHPIEMLMPHAVRERHRAGLAHYRSTGHGQLVDGGTGHHVYDQGADVPSDRCGSLRCGYRSSPLGSAWRSRRSTSAASRAELNGS